MFAVRSRGEVCRVDPEASRLLCPGFANELVGREAAERLEAAGVVVGIQEQLEVRPELVMAVVVVAPDRILERAVHPLNLSVCPRVPRLGQAMLDAALLAGALEGVQAVEPRLIALGPIRLRLGFGFFVDRRAVDELGAVVGEHGVDRGGHGRDEGAQEVRRDPAGRLLVQLSEGELARAVDGHKQVEPALFGVHLGDVDGEEADRVGRDRGSAWACRPPCRAAERCRGAAGSGAGLIG
jgi:hypothetical protein